MRLLHIAVAILCSIPAFAETHTLDKEKGAAALAAAAREGVELRGISTVRDSVGVTAVLLTQPSVRRLFGNEIAKTYAVVQLIISNKNPDAAFVLHSAYIDTSQWALGGGTKGFAVDGMLKNDGAAAEPARSGSHPNRVASVESRIARGQLLDAQQWSARNWTMRLLTVAGSLASGYSFAFKETGIAKGIAAFNGNLVPGVAFAWPDGAVAQQNRISDFGYQTNKIVGKQSGDIIVCFFPIDVFLSTPIRELFLKSPGLFLSPYQILFGDAYSDVLKQLGLFEMRSQLRQLHPCYSKVFEPQTSLAKTQERTGTTTDSIPATLLETAKKRMFEICKAELANSESTKALIALDYIGRFGLQNIGIFVDGILTIDVDTVPASIDHVTFDGDASSAEFWAAPGEKAGTLDCRFCRDGLVSIAEAGKLGIVEVKTLADASDDRHLRFSMKLTKPVEAGQTLTFVVTKKPADPKKIGHEVKSAPFVYSVSYVQIAPSISNVSLQEKKVTVFGSGFFNTNANPFALFLETDVYEKPVSVTLPAKIDPAQFTFDLPSGVAPGCWTVRVKVGAMEALAPAKSPILVPAAPKITEAARTGEEIRVKGEQMVDTLRCGGRSLNFQLLKAGETRGVDVRSKLISTNQASLGFPADAKTGDWTVQVLQDGEVKSSVKLK